MEKRQKFRFRQALEIIAFVLFLIFLVCLIAFTCKWIFAALRVDLNDFRFQTETSKLSAPNTGINTKADLLYIKKLNYQNSSNLFLALAASIPFFLRCGISAILIAATWYGIKRLIKHLYIPSKKHLK